MTSDYLYHELINDHDRMTPEQLASRIARCRANSDPKVFGKERVTLYDRVAKHAVHVLETRKAKVAA